MDMNPDQWQRITAIFTEALDYPAAERERFLEGACDGDPDLKARVERLLENDDDAADSRFLNPVISAGTELVSSCANTEPAAVSPVQDELVRLSVTAGPLKGEERVVAGRQTCVLGRASDAHLRIPESRRISRYHCRFDVSPPQCRVVDLGSTNGTFVNGERVQESVLKDGDVVTAGEVQIQISIAAIPTSRTGRKTVTPAETARSGPLEDIPREVAGYRILRELGRGAMGTVYLGRHTSTGRRAAVKVIRPVSVEDEGAARRFLREASVLAQLSHPRIVKSYQFGIMPWGLDETPYLITQYVPEIDLRRILENSPFPVRIRISVGIITRILSALQYAHEQGVVHRDVKPSNFLAYRQQRKLQVKLADFGIAKSYLAASMSGFTGSDEFCGTLAYSSPEQLLDCRHARPHCDIYAAGVCLYELLTGLYHYDFEDALSAVGLILNTDPYPVRERCADVPAALAASIDRALHRNPEQRYASAEEFAEVLRPFATRQR